MISLTDKNIRKLFESLTLLLIFLISLFFRFTGLNWDQGHHLHPDERFLNMLVNDISLPKSFFEYLDPSISSLNPRNHGRDFYVYGNFPVTLSKIVVKLTNTEGLEKVAMVGRVLSAIADSTTVIVVFLISGLLQKNLLDSKNKPVLSSKFPLWASLVYGSLVLPIQQAHFFTSDTFIALFSFSCVYFSLKYLFEANSKQLELIYLIIASVFLGIAIASKITGVVFLPFILFSIFLKIFSKKEINKIRAITKPIFELLIFLIFGYISLRLASPYLFTSSNFFDPTLEPAFISNLEQLKSFEGADVWFPPAVQWINRPITYGLRNFAIFGIGLIASIFSLIGVFNLVIVIKKWLSVFIKKVKKRELSFSNSDFSHLAFASLCLWMMGVIGYYSFQFVNSIRYLYPITPFVAIFAGLGITSLLKTIKHTVFSVGLILIGLFIWPLMFVGIYLKPHSRVMASAWIYQNIPQGSRLLSEHWDDGLPLHLSEYSHRYQTTQLPVFGTDTSEKWKEMHSLLNEADYYILSSNRGWESISRVPEKYPQMAKFYEELFANETQYKQVAKFSSYPNFHYLGLPISFNDSWAEEAFTVYDHPEIYIFKRTNSSAFEE